MKESAGKKRSVLVIVENLPVPFDRRVWQESGALRDAGYQVTIICPRMKGYETSFEVIEGINIYRHPLPLEARGALGYLLEYSVALFFQFYLAWKVLFKHGFDVIHACNPPDTIFLVGGFFKLLGKKFLFDHHDINPELYDAKFEKRDIFYKLICLCERLTFATAKVSIATNESYRKIAIERGKMKPGKVFVVRSGPNLGRLKIQPKTARYKNNRQYLVGYVGVIGRQEGVDLLLKSVEYIVYKLQRTDIQFVIVGSGPELDCLRQMTDELKLNDFVEFTGRLPDEDMLEALNNADVCVNPDIANEMNDKSTMNKIMEYMALGKPIVQFDLTEGKFSAQQASVYAKKNDLVDFADKIVELLADSERCEQMGRYGRNRVENELEWQYEVPKLLAAYDALWD